MDITYRICGILLVERMAISTTFGSLPFSGLRSAPIPYPRMIKLLRVRTLCLKLVGGPFMCASLSPYLLCWPVTI